MGVPPTPSRWKHLTQIGHLLSLVNAILALLVIVYFAIRASDLTSHIGNTFFYVNLVLLIVILVLGVIAWIMK